MAYPTRIVGLAAGPLLVLAAQPLPAAAGAAPRPHPPAPAAPPAVTYRMRVTYYGAYDNDPPGSTGIAYPVLHDRAGGTGTYEDPITFATAPAELPAGTRIYYPYLKKYFVMEDYCAACERDWRGRGSHHRRLRHIDLWTGDSADRAIAACERRLTRSGRVPVVVRPPRDEEVDTAPLFDSAALACRVPLRTAGGPQDTAGPAVDGGRGGSPAPPDQAPEDVTGTSPTMTWSRTNESA